MTEQLDIFTALEANERAARTAHLPLTFTVSTGFTAAELSESFEAWGDENGRFGMIPRSHMWHPALTEPFGPDQPHSPWVMQADLRCRHFETRCFCVTGYLYRVYCSDCRWWSQATEDEGYAVREYHDHCWPGWRTLPVIASPSGERKAKLPADYPQEWQIPGAPILTHRTSPGTRNVAGRSPFCGYDMTDPKCLEKK